jgi:hypothetical protein
VFPGGRFSPVEVLQFLAFYRKTGTLKAWLPDETVSIDLRQGHLVDQSSDNSPPGYRLGEILVRQGAIPQPRLDNYLELFGHSRKRLGRGLRSVGLINRKRLCQALRTQLLASLTRILRVDKCTLEFVPRDNPYGSVDLWIDLNAVLLEASAFVDET